MTDTNAAELKPGGPFETELLLCSDSSSPENIKGRPVFVYAKDGLPRLHPEPDVDYEIIIRERRSLYRPSTHRVTENKYQDSLARFTLNNEKIEAIERLKIHGLCDRAVDYQDCVNATIDKVLEILK